MIEEKLKAEGKKLYKVWVDKVCMHNDADVRVWASAHVCMCACVHVCTHAGSASN